MLNDSRIRQAIALASDATTLLTEIVEELPADRDRNLLAGAIQFLSSASELAAKVEMCGARSCIGSVCERRGLCRSDRQEHARAARLMGDIEQLAKLREPFPPSQVGKLPKGGGVTLDFVGHGYLTARLLDVDPLWNWEPLALDDQGLPLLDEHGGLWIKLTVCGMTRLGYGDAGGRKGPNATKEAIGDALRNAGMRFGAALDLWAKGDPDAPAPPKPKTPADLARDKLAALVKKHELNGKQIGQRFADDYGMSIYEADEITITAFAQVIADEAADKATDA